MPELRKRVSKQYDAEANELGTGKKRKREHDPEKKITKKKSAKFAILSMSSERNFYFHILSSPRPPTVLRDKQGNHVSAYALQLKKVEEWLPQCSEVKGSASEIEEFCAKHYEKIKYQLEHLCDQYKIYFKLKSGFDFNPSETMPQMQAELCWLYQELLQIDKGIQVAIDQARALNVVGHSDQSRLTNLLKSIEYLANSYLYFSNRLPYATFFVQGTSEQYGAEGSKTKRAIAALKHFERKQNQRHRENMKKALKAMSDLLSYPKLESDEVNLRVPHKNQPFGRSNDLDLAALVLMEHCRNIFDVLPNLRKELRAELSHRFIEHFAGQWGVEAKDLMLRAEQYEDKKDLDLIGSPSFLRSLAASSMMRAQDERSWDLAEVETQSEMDSTDLLEALSRCEESEECLRSIEYGNVSVIASTSSEVQKTEEDKENSTSFLQRISSFFRNGLSLIARKESSALDQPCSQEPPVSSTSFPLGPSISMNDQHKAVVSQEMRSLVRRNR